MRLDMQVDAKEVQRAFNKAPQKVIAGARSWVNRTATRSVRQGVQESPVQTGDLNRSIRASYAKQGLEAKVQPNVKHALPVHTGTGIYGPKKRPITPRSGKVLSFVANGQRIFVKSIKGQKANPFMDRAYKIVKPQVDRDAVSTLDKIVRSI